MHIINSALATEFQQRLHNYGQRAVRYKHWYQASWYLITLSVWATLLLAISGLAWPDVAWLRDVVLDWVIPILGIIVTIGTIAQSALRLLTKWTSYRHATEHLKSAYMKHRADLLTEQELRALDGQIKDWAGRGKRIQGGYLYALFALPADLREEFPDFAAEVDMSGKPLTIPLAIRGRLQHQRRWMIRKMRMSRLVYLAFQLAIVLISLGNTWYVWSFGRNFTWVALTTAVSLAIIACRDFLSLDRLILQYLDTASGLEAIKKEYESADPDDQAKLRNLVQRVEYLLEHESEAWYHQHAGPVAIQSVCIPNSGG